MTRSKVKSSSWDIVTQVINDRQYVGKKDPEFMLVTARTVVTPCNSVIPDVDTNCEKYQRN